MLSDEQIKKTWNMFPPEGRDMKYEDFRKEVRNLTDPVKMQQDLEMMKARQRSGRLQHGKN